LVSLATLDPMQLGSVDLCLVPMMLKDGVST
jgi:hypothetical protein